MKPTPPGRPGAGETYILRHGDTLYRVTAASARDATAEVLAWIDDPAIWRGELEAWNEAYYREAHGEPDDVVDSLYPPARLRDVRQAVSKCGGEMDAAGTSSAGRHRLRSIAERHRSTRLRASFADGRLPPGHTRRRTASNPRRRGGQGRPASTARPRARYRRDPGAWTPGPGGIKRWGRMEGATGRMMPARRGVVNPGKGGHRRGRVYTP